MAIQESVAVRNARLDAIETTIGVSAILALWTGAQPANCAAANSGTEVARMSLPSDWMSAAAAGVKSLLGSWTDPTGNAAGVAGHFRIYASDGTTCGMQGSVTITGSGGDLTLDNTNIAVGQAITITSFTLTEPNS